MPANAATAIGSTFSTCERCDGRPFSKHREEEIPKRHLLLDSGSRRFGRYGVVNDSFPREHMTTA
jgi:hypothetical protein